MSDSEPGPPPASDHSSVDPSSSDSSFVPSKFLEKALKDHVNAAFAEKDSHFIEEGTLNLTLTDFNLLFLPKGAVKNDTKANLDFYGEFTTFVGNLESLKSIKVSIYRLYPLLRKALVVTEGHFVYTFKKLAHERSSLKFCELLSGDDLICSIIDSFYGENNVFVSRDHLLRIINFDSFQIETSFKSIEVLSELMLSLVSEEEDYDVRQPENLIGVVLFNHLQKVVSLFLVLALLESNNSYSLYDFHQGSTEETKSTDTKVESISKLTTQVLKPTKFPEEDASLRRLSLEMFKNVWDLLSGGLDIVNEVASSNQPLFDSLATSLYQFAPYLKEDLPRSLGALERLTSLLSRNLSKVCKFSREQMVSLYNQVMKTLNEKKNKSSNKGSIPLTTHSRDLSTFFQRKNLEKSMGEYSKLLEFFLKFFSNVSEKLHEVEDNRLLYKLMNSLNKFNSDVVTLILLSDGLEYISKNNPNLETLASLKNTVEKSFELSSQFVKSLPFESVNGLFYYAGSRLNNKNTLSQIYLFNVIDFESLSEKDYEKYIKMLESLMKRSNEMYFTPVLEDKAQTPSKQLQKKYLKFKFELICKIFLKELSSKGQSQSLVELFASWCYSANVHQNLLARSMCQFIIRLSEKREEYKDVCRYLMDILLGLYFFTNFDQLGSARKPKARSHHQIYGLPGRFKSAEASNEPLKPSARQVNSLNYIKMFLASPLSDWLMENVVLTYTCAFVRSIRDLVRSVHSSISCKCCLCDYKCFFQTRLMVTCNCFYSPIVSMNPSISHYLEFIKAVSPAIKANQQGRLQSLWNFVMGTLSNLLKELVAIIVESKEKGDPKLRFILFKISIKLANAIANSQDFELNETNSAYLIRLFSLIGSSEICKAGNAEEFIHQLCKTLIVLDLILSKSDNQPLMDLHKGLLKSLVGKIQRFPLMLTSLEFYKKGKGTDDKRYTGAVEEILKGARGLESYTLRVVYKYHSWKYYRNNGLEEQAERNFIQKYMETKEERIEFRVFANLFFTLLGQVKDVHLKIILFCGVVIPGAQGKHTPEIILMNFFLTSKTLNKDVFSIHTLASQFPTLFSPLKDDKLDQKYYTQFLFQ